MTAVDPDALDSFIDRLEAHYVAAGQGALPLGLSEDEISAQEELLGWRLPPELRHVYTRHAYYRLQESPFTYLPGSLPGSVENTLLARHVFSLPDMVSDFASLGMANPWRDSLVVLLNGGHAFFVFMDCNPTADRVGQVYEFGEAWHHTPTFPSLAEAFRCWVRQLDAGYRYPARRVGDIVVWETNDDNWPPDLPRSSYWLWQ